MIERLIFPKRCPICDEVISSKEYICKKCEDIPRIVPSPRCIKCSKHVASKGMLCADCERENKSFQKGMALYEYDSVKESIHALKDSARYDNAVFFANMIYKNLGDIIASFKAEAIIPIPLHADKLKKRGFNQSLLIADELSKLIKIPVRDDILLRVEKTKDQKTMTHYERQNNLVGAFHMPQNDVKLDTVLLLDDVYTTGATMEEATRTLMRGGVNKVYFVTAAIGIGE